MKVSKSFTVPGRGVGRPDYTPAVAASKPVIVKNEEKWALLVTRKSTNDPPDPIEANKSVTVTIKAADNGNINGWQLNMGGGVVSCNASCIQRIVMCHTPGIVGDFRYDVRGDIVFGPLSSTIINPDEDLVIIIYNNDDVARDFSVSLVGVLEKISG